MGEILTPTKKRVKPLIGVLAAYFDGRYQTILHRGICEAAHKRGVDVAFFLGGALGSPHFGQKEANALYRLLTPESVDALIMPSEAINGFLSPQELERVIQPWKNAPVVSIALGHPDIPDVVCDNYAGMKECVAHFLEHHNVKRLAFVRGAQTNKEAVERFRAYQDSLAEHGIEFDPDLVLEGDFSNVSGRQVAQEIDERGRHWCQAIVFSNDEMALTAMEALAAKGWVFPRDLPCGGFDDVPDAFLRDPPLTSVQQGIYDQGALLIDLALRRMNGETIPQETRVPAKLVLRESCGCQTPISFGLGTGQPQRVVAADFVSKPTAMIEPLIETLGGLPWPRDELREALTGMLSLLSLDLAQLRPFPLVREAFVQWMDLTVNREAFHEVWQTLLFSLRPWILESLTESVQIEYVHGIFSQFLGILARKVRQKEQAGFKDLQHFLHAHPSSSTYLETQDSPDAVLKLILSNFDALGVNSAWLGLHPEGSRSTQSLDGSDVLVTRLRPKSQGTGCEIVTDPPIESPLWWKQCCARVQTPGPWVVQELSRFGYHFGILVLSIGNRPAAFYTLLAERIAEAFSIMNLQVLRNTEGSLLKTELETLRSNVELNTLRWENTPVGLAEIDASMEFQVRNASWKAWFGERKLSELVGGPTARELRNWLLNQAVQPFDSQQVSLHFQGKIFPVLDVRKVTYANRKLGAQLTVVNAGDWIKKDFERLDRFRKDFGISPREGDVLELLLQGFRIKDVADKLGIAESTVKGHVAELYTRLGVDNRSDLREAVNAYHSRVWGVGGYSLALLGRVLSTEAVLETN